MYRAGMGVAERGTILLGGSSEAPNSGMARRPACRTFAVGAVGVGDAAGERHERRRRLGSRLPQNEPMRAAQGPRWLLMPSSVVA